MHKLDVFYKSCWIILLFALQITIDCKAQIVDIQPQASEKITLGVFKNGVARVIEHNDEYFINTKGDKIHIYNGLTWGQQQANDKYKKDIQEDSLLPRGIEIFKKNGLEGIIDPEGKIIIPAEYTRIDARSRNFWELYKNNKKSFYLPDGILPFFEDIGYLDGEHFDVKQNNAWHIYSKSQKQIITKTTYEGFDYCGGCGQASPYVYAKKNGKWGIIDWKETVLLPFEFDHEHAGMRNDNWVQSFSKNGKQVIVHIPTRQIFDVTDGKFKLISGMLIGIKDGKFGAYNNDAKLIIPFEYDKIEEPNQNHYLGYYGNYLIVEKNHKKGVIRSDGTITIPIEYENVMVYDDYFVALKEGKSYLFEQGNNTPLLQIDHGEIIHINDYFYSSGSNGLNIFRVKQKAYHGLYFAESNNYHEPEFYKISLEKKVYFDDHQIIIADKQGQKTLFNHQGKQLLPFEVEDFELFNKLDKPLLSIKIKGKWGLYDLQQQKQFIPPSFDRYFKVLGNPGHQYIQAAIERDGGWDDYELYDSDGKKVIDYSFRYLDSIDHAHYLITINKNEETGTYAIFNIHTKTLKQLDYPFVSLSGSPQLLVVSKNNIEGKLYHIKQKKELQRKYAIYRFSGWIDPDSELEHQQDYNWGLSYFSNGLARIDSKDGIGFIDENEKIVIEPKYQRAQIVNKNYFAITEIDEKTNRQSSFFINKTGKRLFPKAYYIDDILFYNLDNYNMGDIVILKKSHDYSTYFGLGDLKKGKLLTHFVYKDIVPLHGSSYLILSQIVPIQVERKTSTIQKYGLATSKGEILFEPQFEDIHFVLSYNNENAVADIFPLLVRIGEKWKYINADGSFLPVEGDQVLRY